MNTVILQGNVTKDPNVREIQAGDRTSLVANFSVAVSQYYKKANGETIKQTEFVDCEAWDTNAETIRNIVYKGDPILIEGSLKTEKWEKDGVRHSKTRVKVKTFQKFARYVKDKSESDETEVEPELETSTVGGEDIPF